METLTFEAESISYAVCKYFGIETGENSFGYIASWSQGKELKELIESHGGKVTGSVTSKTNYLINNDAMSNSTKNKKARELGIPILTEQAFIEQYHLS